MSDSTETVALEKTALRKRMRCLLAARSNERAQASPVLPETTKTLFAYLSHGGELSVSALIGHAVSRGCAVAAPRVAGNDLRFHRIDSAEGPFSIGAYGIREPLERSPRMFPSSGSLIAFPVTILVPGLAFDRAGHRLGRGAGFYDRFLEAFLATFPDRRAEITVMGVCREEQIVDSVPVEGHDIGVDCLLCEKGVILCTKP